MNRVLRRTRSGLLTLVAFMALAACTLPGTSGGTVTISYDQKDPSQILQDVRSAMKGAKNMTVTISATDDTGATFKFTITGDGKGNTTGNFTQGSISAAYVFVGGKSYVKGHDFWARAATENGGSSSLLATIDDKYVLLNDDITSGLDPFKDPAVLADCLEALGTLTRSSTDSVGGQGVVVLAAKGSATVSSAKLYVATNSPHYLLKVVIDDANKNFGGTSTNPKCNSATPSPGSSGTTFSGAGTVTLTDFGKAQTITVPAGFIDLNTIGG